MASLDDDHDDGLTLLGRDLPDFFLGWAEQAAASGDEDGAAFGRTTAMRLWTDLLWREFEDATA